jgi:hypothetical protein
MPDEPLLRQCARAAIERGAIPRERPERFWGGRGTGEACTNCETIIPQGEVEIEIELPSHGSPDTRPDIRYFHVRCFAAWELERTKV